MQTLRHGFKSVIVPSILMVLFAFSSSVFAERKREDGRVATVKDVIGSVYHKYIDNRGRQARKSVEAGDAIWETDVVETEAGGRVKLEFVEGDGEKKNIIVLGPDTQLRIERASNGKTQPGTELHLKKGSIKSNVHRKYTGQGLDQYKVVTPAVVAGVRGTVFLVEHEDKGISSTSTVATLEGKVFVGAVGNLAGGVPINKGMHVSAVYDRRGSAVLSRVVPISENSRLQRRIKIFNSKMPVHDDRLSQANPYGLTPGLVEKGRENVLSRDAMDKARAKTQDKRILEGVSGVDAASAGMGKLPAMRGGSASESAPVLRVPTQVPAAAPNARPVEVPKAARDSIQKTGLSGGLK